MKSIRYFTFILMAGFALMLSGCGEKHDEKDGHGHAPHDTGKAGDDHTSEEKGGDDHGHGSEASGASYEEGKGIALLEETKKALGVELAEVAEREVRSQLKLTAQVYRSASESSRQYGKERQGNAYATALIAPDAASQLKSGDTLNFASRGQSGETHQGVVWKIDSSQVPILGKAEALLELPDADSSLKVGDFVEAKIPLTTAPAKMLGVPHSAVLKTSTGTFAFVQNGNFLLRTEIKTGVSSDDYVEVTEGLYEGDTIAVKPVEALYLIELRATKGGGHSH